MKSSNVNFILSAAAALLLLSCARELPVSEAIPAAGEQAPSSSQKEVVWNINVSNGGDTKGIKSGWEEGDVVYVFFKDLINAGDGKSAYLELKYENSRWSFTPKNGLDYGSIASGLNASALYFPYGNDMTLSWDDTDGVVFSNKTATSSGFLYATSSVTVEQGGEFSTIGANFIMQPNANIVRFFIPDENAEGVAELKGNCIYPFKVTVSGDATMTFNGPGGSKTDPLYPVPGIAATVNGDKGWYFYGRALKIGTLFFHLKLPDDSRYTLFKTRNAIETGKSYTMPSIDFWQPVGNDKYVKMGGNYWCTYYAYGNDNGQSQPEDVFTYFYYYANNAYSGLSTEQKFASLTDFYSLWRASDRIDMTFGGTDYTMYIDKESSQAFPKHLLFRTGYNLATNEGTFRNYVTNGNNFSIESNTKLVIRPILDTLGNKPIYNPPVSGEEDF